MDAPHFVLIHAPLVGPLTWALAAAVLRQKGFAVTVPRLPARNLPARNLPARNLPARYLPGKPYWQQHAEAVTDALVAPNAGADTAAPVFLIAHSGAGPLLPIVRQRLGRPAGADFFVDALLPEDGKSYLDQFGDAAAVAAFRQSARDGLLPVWTEDDLREVIPDDAVRHAFAAELRPLPLAVYEEPIPAYAGWPDAPSAYLRFGANPAYDRAYQRAQEAGFALETIEGKHFHMLTQPEQVAQALVDLAHRLGFAISQKDLDA
jgi:hypothetical protein